MKAFKVDLKKLIYVIDNAGNDNVVEYSKDSNNRIVLRNKYYLKFRW